MSANAVRVERAGDLALDESLSCLLDGETDHAECARLIERLAGDPQARARWAELNLVSDAMRSSEVATLHSAAFSQRFAAALADEPTVLAPAAGRRRYQRVLLPGVAAAAAIALLAVGVVPQMQAARETAPVAAAPSTEAVAATGGDVARVPELERYLLAHRELAGGVGMPRPAQYLRSAAAVTVERR